MGKLRFDEWWEKEGEPLARDLFGDTWDANVYTNYCETVAEEAWRAVVDFIHGRLVSISHEKEK